MTERNASALKSPIIGKVIGLGKELHKRILQIPKRIQYVHGYKILAETAILFKYAKRQVIGNGDYFKRALEVVEEIQSDIYYLHSVCGCWTNKNKKILARMDAMCDEIIEQLCKIKNKNASFAKPNDECK